MTDYDDQVHVQVDGDAKDLAKEKLGFGGLSREIRNLIDEVAFGEEVSQHTRLEHRLQSLREDKNGLRAKRRELDAKIEEKEQGISRIEEQLTHLDKREDKFEAALEMLEETLYAGMRVDPEHGQVKRAARIGNVEPGTVIERLQERNPSVPEFAFVDGLHDGRDWKGVDDRSRETGIRE